MKEQFKKRLAMLKEQYRMDDQICRLISSRMYKNDLQTASGRAQSSALCRFLESCDYLQDTSRVGVCTPYAAQSKVLQRILAGTGLSDMVEAGTVHRYQGDEKHVMIIDIPDSHGEQRAGVFLDADHVDDSGAMLYL
jgi:superfamily I DNA and/or RNA helicase